MAVSARASTFAVGTPVRQHTVARTQARRASRLSAPVRAKYGDESQFFDLDDLENSAGSWDLYGTEDERRYPGLQAEFFQRAAAPLRRREAILGFVGIGWSAGILLWGANGSKWAKLPIQNGPKKGAVIGPRGRI
ncbi:hypothetical protein WJX82_007816 [Trebouxia sp. C0006]|nr:MAG: photosystem I subunit chloroplast precursor [Trebouxia sp. A1-2]KAA6419457.1 MAG: photosystem I subunit chloroplast precursor [Trebouxia sp. A1-2]